MASQDTGSKDATVPADEAAGSFATTLQAVTPGSSFGPYRIERLLGQGGMGEVHEGTHSALGKRVAIKTLRREVAAKPAVRTRFIREGQAASKVRHPNVVDVYDVGEEHGTPYLVMEFLDGETLGALLEKKKRLEPAEACDILIPVLAALAAAHDQNVVHRDLKPDNVFLCAGRGGAPQPKIVDFGISKQLVDDPNVKGLTATAAMLGTPYYMSPEQAQNSKTLGGATDQYSVGVILYEALTGRRPFESESLFGLMRSIVAGEYEDPLKVMPDLPQPLASAITRAMSAAASERFADVRALGRALLPYASERTRLMYKEELVDPMAATRPSEPKAASAPGPGTITTATGELLPSGKSGSIKVWMVVGGIGAAAVLIGAGLSLRRGPEGSATQPSSVSPALVVPSSTASLATATNAESARAQAPASSVQRTIRSTPANADVLIAGQKVGSTPHTLAVAAGKTVDVELHADGYETAKLQVDSTSADDIPVELRKSAAPAGPRPTGHPGGKSLPSLAPR